MNSTEKHQCISFMRTKKKNWALRLHLYNDFAFLQWILIHRTINFSKEMTKVVIVSNSMQNLMPTSPFPLSYFVIFLSLGSWFELSMCVKLSISPPTLLTIQVTCPYPLICLH